VGKREGHVAEGAAKTLSGGICMVNGRVTVCAAIFSFLDFGGKTHVWSWKKTHYCPVVCPGTTGERILATVTVIIMGMSKRTAKIRPFCW
jgi:hypothetical protein